MARRRFNETAGFAAASTRESRREPLRLFEDGEVRRLNVNLPVIEHEQLREIARSTGRTMTECVKAALRLLVRTVDEERQGNRLAFVSGDGALIQEVRVTAVGRAHGLRVKTGTRAGIVVGLQRQW